MTRFSYTAERAGGEVYHGIADVPDRFALYSIIRTEGGKMLHIEEDATEKIWTLAYWGARIGSVKEHDKILFARNTGSMIAAGLPLSRALSIMERQASTRLRRVVAALSASVSRGTSFHDSLAQFPEVFSPLTIAMVRAGEEGGDLASTLKLVADQNERTWTLKKKVQGALIYPAIIVTAIVGVGALLMIEVVPTLAETFKQLNATLPTSTRIVIGVSDFLTQYTLISFGLTFGLIVAVRAGMRTTPGKRAKDYILLHMPIIGAMTKEINAARTTRTLASLLGAGVDMLSAIAIVRDVLQNSYFKETLESGEKSVAQGEVLSQTFLRHTHLYPVFVGEMMTVGEETGELVEMLRRIAVYYEEEVERKTKDMSTIIEPFLMLFIGAAVGFFAVSMISPIYQLTANIQ